MAAIGTFRKEKDGSFTGVIRTLTLNLNSVAVRPTKGDSDKSPDYRVLVGAAEVGAAWTKTSRDNRTYLALKLDDPCFPVGIYASLIEAQEGYYSLVWSRSRTAG